MSSYQLSAISCQSVPGFSHIQGHASRTRPEALVGRGLEPLTTSVVASVLAAPFGIGGSDA